MRCPKCNRLEYQITKPCPDCNFSGNPEIIEELVHVKWVLSDIKSWWGLGIDDQLKQPLSGIYLARRQELEIALGLRARPFTKKEAGPAWRELIHHQALYQKISEFLDTGKLEELSAQKTLQELQSRIDELASRLEGHDSPNYPQTTRQRSELTASVLESLRQYIQQNKLSLTEKAAAPSPLPAEELALEAGLQPAPAQAPAEMPLPAAQKGVEAQAKIQTPPPSAPKVPVRERLARTLLSERTLQAILFLGIFLIFAAALSFVIWGWKDFSALARIAIPSISTVLFLILGRYIRLKTPLPRSGIAISAIAALLIPIDFYTVYVNFGNPPEFWPQFWLGTSLICLIAYTVITLSIQSRLFGYLVVTAAGSALMAAIETIGISPDWYSASLSLLAAVLLIIAAVLSRRPGENKLAVFAEPFRYMALLIPGILMPLTLVWRLIDRSAIDTLHYAVTANWLLGSLIFGWGAIHHRSRSLGLLAPSAFPAAVFMFQSALFENSGVDSAWHAFGLALLVPLYFTVGYRLTRKEQESALQANGQVTNRWGIALLLVTAFLSLTNLKSGAAAASTHTVLAGAVSLAAFLWRRPTYVYPAALLTFSASTFVMAESGLAFEEISAGWASLAILYIVLAYFVGKHVPANWHPFAKTLSASGYLIGALAVIPPMLVNDSSLYAYTLGNWIALAAWGARLAHTGQPGFADWQQKRKAIFHWLTAIPLPFWVAVIYTNHRELDATLALVLAGLGWVMAGISYRLEKTERAFRTPWYASGLVVAHAAAYLAFTTGTPSTFTFPISLLALGLLYLTDAFIGRVSFELFPGGLITYLGVISLLNRLELSPHPSAFIIATIVAIYILGGLGVERRRSEIYTHQFLTPLYLITHLITSITLLAVFSHPFNQLFGGPDWTDEMRLWGAATQLLIGIVYGFYSWGTYKRYWGHFSAWLGVSSGFFIAIIVSSGSGRSAVLGALGAILYVLSERGLDYLHRSQRLKPRQRAIARLAWNLYKRPFLFAGWTISALTIGLALVRNLWLLDGGRTQQIWAVISLSLLTALYAFSAPLFRKSRFAWFAAILVIAPWTILTHLGWFTAWEPTAPQYAISWVGLAWALFGANRRLTSKAPPSYLLPVNTVTHTLLPLSLLWGIADPETSRITFGLSIGLYGLAAALNHRGWKISSETPSIFNATRLLYPALMLIPVWCVYLLAWVFPGVQHEHFGLMFLVFAPLGLLAGSWFTRITPLPENGFAYALPAHLTGYLSLIVGTMLLAHNAPLLALTLVYDAVIMLVSAWRFKNPGWVYPAGVFIPIAMLIALKEAQIPPGRQGWWLIGLAAAYLALAWLLRRVKLAPYSNAPLAIAFALIALGLPPSSRDQIGALWGYGSAVLLYALTAFWLRQPLLLTPASALAIVPYAVALHRSAIPPEFTGLALFPGALLSLGLGQVLSKRFGDVRDFPWNKLTAWPVAAAERFLSWWGLPLYGLGLGLAAASPLFTTGRSDLTALNFLLLMPVFGWAIYRFRLRIWLFATALAGHLALGFLLDGWGCWHCPTQVWLRFLPAPVLTAIVGVWIARRLGESSPLEKNQWHLGWSRPLYALVFLDILEAQSFSMAFTDTGAAVTLAHALIVLFLASSWLAPRAIYVSSALGAYALWQLVGFHARPFESFVTASAQLALGYGLVGYGLTLWQKRPRTKPALPAWLVAWETPFQKSGQALSLLALLITGIWGIPVFYWSLRAVLGFSYRHLIDPDILRMAISVLTFTGLLYLTKAYTQRRTRLSYFASAMLLAAWTLFAFYLRQWDGRAQVQWYAIPTGLYILGVAFMEWRLENKSLARWLDYAAMFLMMGSLFRQTLEFGWGFALLLGGEGLASIWWGSARRLRRFLYAGMVGVILATLGQLINSLQSVNQWITFGVIGLLLVAAALLIERRLENIKALQDRLDSWE